MGFVDAADRFDQYGGFEPLNVGGVEVLICPVCWAVVVDWRSHRGWHERLETEER